jgi:hypothetical protein
MVFNSMLGKRNERAERTKNKETFLFLKREGLTKASSLLAAITETDSILSASQSFEISSSVALGIPSLYFGKGAMTEMFMD